MQHFYGGLIDTADAFSGVFIRSLLTLLVTWYWQATKTEVLEHFTDHVTTVLAGRVSPRRFIPQQSW